MSPRVVKENAMPWSFTWLNELFLITKYISLLTTIVKKLTILPKKRPEHCSGGESFSFGQFGASDESFFVAPIYVLPLLPEAPNMAREPNNRLDVSQTVINLVKIFQSSVRIHIIKMKIAIDTVIQTFLIVIHLRCRIKSVITYISFIVPSQLWVLTILLILR